MTMALALSGVCAPLSESRAASAQDSLAHAPVEGAPVGPGYVLGPGDRLQVFVSTLADTSRVVTLDRDGKVFIPRVGSTYLFQAVERLCAAHTGLRVRVMGEDEYRAALEARAPKSGLPD